MIIGAGRQGAETLQVARQISERGESISILGFLDDHHKQGSVLGTPILGGIEEAETILNEHPECKAISAIGNTITRKKVVEKYKKVGFSFDTLIHPNITISNSVEVGIGTLITARCVLTVDIKIGNHVLINPLSSIAHDVKIGDFVTVNSLVALSGNDVIEDGVYIGVGAKLTQGLRVGAWSILGAGAIVIKDIPSGVVAVGVPAKPIKEIPLFTE